MGGVIGYAASAYALEKVNSVAVLGFLAEAMLQMTDCLRCSGQSGSNRRGNGGKTVVGLQCVGSNRGCGNGTLLDKVG